MNNRSSNLMPLEPQQTGLSSVTPVILAGGEGRRLWPLSRSSCPKPFLKFRKGRTMLQNTMDYARGMKAPYVIANKDHRELVMQQIAAIDQLILEPTGKGTAPAVASAAHYMKNKGDGLVLVMPSDHDMKNVDVLYAAICKGIKAAEEGHFVLLGIKPRKPSPHFGYIKCGHEIADGVHEAKAFIEKPSKSDAKNLIAEGGYYWNSGIFLFKISAYLEELSKLEPEISEASYNAVARASRLQNAIYLNEDIFGTCPAQSIDRGIMEKTARKVIVPVNIPWRDLGTWPSFLAGLFKG